MSKLKDSMRVKIREDVLREKEVQEKGIATTFEAILSEIVLGSPADLSYIIEQFEKRGFTLSESDIEWIKSELLTLEFPKIKSILDTIEIIEDVELDESPSVSLPTAETYEEIGTPLSAFACQDIDFNELADSADDIDSELQRYTEQKLKDFLDSLEKIWD